MLAHALRAGAQEILLGIGGSATNDGGMGMLEALGVRFYDADGNILAGCGAALGKVRRMDLAGMLPQVRAAHITVICDVSNPLLGPTGATAVYGPQKGVTPELMPVPSPLPPLHGTLRHKWPIRFLPGGRLPAPFAAVLPTPAATRPPCPLRRPPRARIRLPFLENKLPLPPEAAV